MKPPAKLTRFRDVPQFVRDGSYQVNIPLDYVLPWIERQQDAERNRGMSLLNLDPDFQRPHVWSDRQRTAWLEYWFRGGRSGTVIYFNHPGWSSDYKGDFVLVDGKQRIESVRRFLNNEIKVFGSYFREFTDKPRDVTTSLLFNVNTLKTRAEVLAWYLQFNFGGTPHSRAEMNRVIGLYEAEVGK